MAVWSRASLSRIMNYDRIDGEYFLPEYLDNDTTLSKLPTFSLPERFYISDGNHMSMSKHFSEDGDVPYYRGQDVNDFFLENATPVKIPYSVYDSALMQRSHFKEGDVLISIVGTIGSLSVVSNKIGSATGSCKIAILRGKGGFSPYALAAFLSTKYGQLQIKRNTRGAIQMGLILRDLVRIRVPDFDSHQAKEIASLIQKAIKKNRESKESYSAAERLLAEALKLDDLKLDRPLSYTAKFSDVLREGRADADYFQVPYVQMHRHLDKLNTVRLSALVDFTKGVEVGSGAYVDEGKLFMRVSNLTVRGLKFNTSDRFVSKSTYDLLKSACQPRVGELLLTKDGSPGVCWVMDREIEALMSGAIVRMSLKNREVPAEYLALAINSKLCQMQVEQNASGALILHWKLPLIKRLRVPLCDQETMKAIAKLVKESKRQQAKSEALLAEAKATVERLIEAAAAQNVNLKYEGVKA